MGTATERAVLGACITSQEALTTVMETLQPDDFSNVNNRLLFGTIAEMYRNNTPPDLVTLPEALKAKGIYDRLGGQSFLVALATEAVSPLNVAWHARIVRDNSVRKMLIDAGERISKLAQGYENDTASVLDKAEKLLFDAGQNRSTGEFSPVRELIGPVFTRIEKNYRSSGKVFTGYPTGFADLDALTGGLKPGSLNIIAGRPSMGKTAFALNIAQFGGNSPEPVLTFSLEMPAEQLIQRMISAESDVNLSKIIHGTFSASEFGRVRQACDIVAHRNIYISDATMLSAMEFRTRCRRFKTRYPELGLVVVDYLQLMTTNDQHKGNRNQEISDITRMLKATAREIDVPVIALSQLSRETERRQDRKPQLSDLRDSGAIEQDADVVMMLYREDYYSENENTDLRYSQADIRIAKNRNGSTGVMHLTFKREITRFVDFGEE